jgi:hypothetical protein
MAGAVARGGTRSTATAWQTGAPFSVLMSRLP